MSKSLFFESLQPGSRYSDTLSKNLMDSSFYLYFTIPDYHADIDVLATITAGSDNTTFIRLDTVLAARINGLLLTGTDKDHRQSIREITPKQFEKYFKENFIEKVKNRKSELLYYDNKEILESY